MAEPPPEATAMEGVDEAAAESLPPQQFSLPLLQLIRTAQSQNGIKHGDYMRYRHHCRSKLQSLYKVLKFQHGRTKYTKRKIEGPTVTDVRFMHIPLFSAERSWAYAMELKKDIENRMDLRKRKHLIKRLAKAHHWASEVSRLAAERGDTKSILESEAYAAWMHGNLLLEKETDWELALANYMRAKKLFDELAKVVPLDQQTMCLQMVEEMEPGIRYCNYQISRKGGAVPDASELLAMADQEGRRGLDLLQSKLSALAQEAQAQQAASTSYLEWQGTQYPVRTERVKLALHQANEFRSQLERVMETEEGSGLEARLALYDRMINAYNEAKSHVRNALKASTASEGDAAHEELSGLELAIQGAVLERSVERTRLLVADAKIRFDAGLERVALGKRAKEKDKYARAEDVVRILEVLARNHQDLADLGAKLGGKRGEALHDVYAAQVSAVQAQRCYYVAQAFLAGEKPLEAYALFGRCGERIKAAQEQLKGSSGGAAAAAELADLSKQLVAYKAVAHAEHFAGSLKSQEVVQQGVGGMSLTDAQPAAPASGPQYLLDNLDTWESFAGQSGAKAPRLFKAPFSMQSIPTRPIMLDTASNYLEYPPLEHRVKRAEKKSVLSSLWSWGSTKK